LAIQLLDDKEAVACGDSQWV